ncbi:hypothetical protein ACKKBF_B33660 [Auxenochlorella protothecoides x Auxenochlorella symbiontica]
MKILILVAVMTALLAQAFADSRRLLAKEPAAEDKSNSCCQELAAIGFSSNLPVVVLDTGGKNITNKGGDVKVRACTCSDGAGFKEYNGTGVASVHGSSSALFDKKSFTLRLTHKNGTKNSASFLGMPKGNEWVLYGGDEVDLTDGMRDYVAYNLARASGKYATRTVWIEVFLVVEGRPIAPSDYHGIYIGEEHIGRGKDRVNVTKWTTADPSGGYIFAFDNNNYGPTDLLTETLPGYDFPFVIKYPKSKVPSENKLASSWLSTYLLDFNTAILADDYLTASPGYTQYIEAPSFIDYFLLTEVTKNPDGYRDSIYMHKDAGKGIAMGPAWDFNEAFGECCGYPLEGYKQGGKSGPGVAGGGSISPNGWRFLVCEDPERCLVEPTDGVSTWFRRMWNDTRFSAAAAERWAELRADAWSDDAISSLINSTAVKIHPAVTRDYKVYSKVLLKSWYASTEAQWTAEVQDLETWLMQRLRWLDAEFSLVASGKYVYPTSDLILVPAGENFPTIATASLAG